MTIIWQKNLEECAFARLTVHHDLSFMFLNDFVDKRKTQARTLTNLFGSKERFKDFGLDFLGNAGTGVFDLDFSHRFSLKLRLARPDKQLPAIRHCIHGVIAEIDYDLLDLVFIRQDKRQISG